MKQDLPGVAEQFELFGLKPITYLEVFKCLLEHSGNYINATNEFTKAYENYKPLLEHVRDDMTTCLREQSESQQKE